MTQRKERAVQTASFAATLMLALHSHPSLNRRDIQYFMQCLGKDPRTWPRQSVQDKRISREHKYLLASFAIGPDEITHACPTLVPIQNALVGSGIGLLCPVDQDYPPQLLRLDDLPSLLFYKGDPSMLCLPQIAIVGSRQASLQGQRTSREFAYQFARGGFHITSGLARGIDAAAHRGCLDGEGKTIAVLACGLDDVYPKRHRSLGQEILAKGGVLLSEYPPGMPALPHQFPIRNRLISGLSQALLVVEAARHSGSVVSAKWAAEQGVDVYAIPGSIYSPQSEGCLDLLRQGALLATAPSDVVASLQLELFDHAPVEVCLSSQAQRLLSYLNSDPVGIDQLVHKTQWPAARVMACLSECEIAGKAAMVANRYIRR